MTDAPDNIKRLVETFGENIDSYRAGGYNEARVRAEFIDPMFTALGWDLLAHCASAAGGEDGARQDALAVPDRRGGRRD